MMYDAAVETRPVEEQFVRDNELFKRQLDYLLHHSDFYKAKLAEAGITSARDINGLEDIAKLPFTEKDEIRATKPAARPMVHTLLWTPLNCAASLAPAAPLVCPATWG